mgnify:FL=1
MKKSTLFLWMLLAWLGITARAQDSAKCSLLTCSAGEEIYSLFGHTALRYEDPARGIDVVFNYGMFSFRVPHFALRFALGETDYQLGVTEFSRFAAEYQWDERDVWQQTLNLTSREKQRLWEALTENYRPENRTYRYNFFYDNCATRPRDRIEACVDGRVEYAAAQDSTATVCTWRDLLHRYTEGHPWARFGIDLCIGSRADKPASYREQMFVPFYMQQYLRGACIVSEQGDRRPLVGEEVKVVDAAHTAQEESLLPSPMQAALLLWAGVTVLSIYGVRRRKSLWALDGLLFGTAGVAGCILAFLAACSQHPAVSPNWLLLILHPLHLFCLPCVLIRVKKKRLSRYMAANGVILTLFIVLLAPIPQFIPPAVLPLTLCLLVRCASNWMLARKTVANQPVKQE